MSLEEEESNKFNDYVILKVRSIENPRMIYTIRREIIYNIMKLGVTIESPL